MGSLSIAVVVAVLAFVSGIIGLLLQRRLPEQHTSDRSRDMIGAMAGLLGLLLALVLGTLVGSSYGFYAMQKSEVETLAARALQLDMALANYGPEAQPGRDGLRMAVRQSYNAFWGGGPADLDEFSLRKTVANLKGLEQFLQSLSPKTDAQKQALAAAGIHASWIEQTRLLMLLQLASPISWPLLIIVVSWSLLLFCGYGLLSRINATTVATLAFGAFSVASAIFLILELSEPYTGLFRIPATGLMQTMDALNP
jgi:hypothetical protein